MDALEEFAGFDRSAMPGCLLRDFIKVRARRVSLPAHRSRPDPGSPSTLSGSPTGAEQVMTLGYPNLATDVVVVVARRP